MVNHNTPRIVLDPFDHGPQMGKSRRGHVRWRREELKNRWAVTQPLSDLGRISTGFQA
jgi:hypothetical protein